jgi:hypothetical protein
MSDQDRVFVSFCSFIFEKRTQDLSIMDNDLKQISNLLQEYGTLNLDVDPCGRASILDFGDDPDASRIVALLNSYWPEFPLDIKLSKDTFPANSLNIQSPSSFRYHLSDTPPFDLPMLHGGPIEVVGGDVSFDSIVDALGSTPADIVFTTDINISGTLVGCTRESLQHAVDVLHQSLIEAPDKDLFGFSLSASLDEGQLAPNIDPVFLRMWVISFSTSDTRCCLQAQRSPR